MKKILSLLTLLLCVCSGAWAGKTITVSKTTITLPDIPSSTLDLTTVDIDENGWYVRYTRSDAGNETWWSKLSNDGSTGQKWTVPTGTIAPFKGATDSDKHDIFTLQNGSASKKTHAIRFTAAEKASFLVSRSSDTRMGHVSLYTYDGTTETLVETKTTGSSNGIHEIIFEDLTPATTYIAYIYALDGSNNASFYEIALKTPVKNITSTVLTGININDVAWDINGLSENAATISTAYVGAPSVEFVYTVNYDDSSTKTGQTETIVATADGGNYVATSTQLTSNVTLTFTNVTVRSASDLAIVSGKGTINTTVGADNYTLTSGTDFTTSSDGAVTYTSTVPGVAYVDATTGELQFFGAGTTVITATQAVSDAFESGSVEFIVNVLPSACLNLGDKDAAIAQLKNGWSYDSPYFDTANKLMIISSYAAYGSANSGFQKWIGQPYHDRKEKDSETWDITDPTTYTVGGASNKGDWSAATPFIGKTGYYRDDSESKVRYATMHSNRPWTIYQFRVKGITAAQAYVKGNNASRYVTISAYEITDGALAATATKSTNTSGNSVTTIAVEELDENKEYLITVRNSSYASNLDFYEIAFTASASDIEIPSNRITTSAAGWASYTPMYKVSGTIYKPGSSSAADDITVYAVSAVDGNEATMATISGGMAANNGYFLKGAANTTYRTTATTGNTAAPETNLIKAQTETGTVKSEGDYTRYALLTYDAENYGLYKLNSTGVTIPAGKAYLEVPVVAARAFDFLNFNFDGETTGINKVVPAEAAKDGVQKFYENGKLVIIRNGVKYNVAGAQVK